MRLWFGALLRFSLVVIVRKNKNSDVFAKKARASVTYENQSDGTSGEESVKNLITELLRKNIQTCHFNIVQIAFNMGKLAGVLFLTVVCAWYIYTSGQHALKKTRRKCDVCVFVHLDSSKKRKRLRRKIQSQKNSINEFIGDYNDLTEESINAEDAENGTFPWLIDGGKYIRNVNTFSSWGLSSIEICFFLWTFQNNEKFYF